MQCCSFKMKLIIFVYHRILRWREGGFVNYWESNYLVQQSVCQLDGNKKNARPMPLKLIQFSSTFIVLGFGLSVSLLVFLIGILRFWHHNRIRSQQPLKSRSLKELIFSCGPICCRQRVCPCRSI